MTNALTEALIADGVSDESIHGERFASPASMDDSQYDEQDVSVEINGEKLQYKSRKNLLDFLEDNDVPMDFACRSGVCGNCKARLVSGKVNSVTEDGLSRDEIKEGYILCCVSRPESDISLEA